MRLFHFSEEPDITEFIPRPVKVSVDRPAGMEWLNGPLVWAIAETHQKLYLFPRECPRIVLWATPNTREADVQYWLQGNRSVSIAYIEKAWLRSFQEADIIRYEFQRQHFIDIDDAGMWVSKKINYPVSCVVFSDLFSKLKENDTELRVVDSLVPLKAVWRSSVHASGIRLRNAQGWGKPSWTHSKPGRIVSV